MKLKHWKRLLALLLCLALSLTLVTPAMALSPDGGEVTVIETEAEGTADDAEPEPEAPEPIPQPKEPEDSDSATDATDGATAPSAVGEDDTHELTSEAAATDATGTPAPVEDVADPEPEPEPEPESAEPDPADDVQTEEPAPDAGETPVTDAEEPDTDADEDDPTEAPESDAAPEPEPVLRGGPLKAPAADELGEWSFYDAQVLSRDPDGSGNYILFHTSGSGRTTWGINVHKAYHSTEDKSYYAYCLDRLKGSSEDKDDNYTITTLPSSAYYQISRYVTALGYGNNSESRLQQMYGYSMNTNEWYQATQAAVWIAQKVADGTYSGVDSAASGLRLGLSSANSGSHALDAAKAIATAALAIRSDGVSMTVSDATLVSTTTAEVTYRFTVTAQNCYGGYSVTVSGLDRSCSLTASDSVTVSGVSSYSSSTDNGTDTITVVLPRGAQDKTYNVSLSLSSYNKGYSGNGSVLYAKSNDSGNQDFLVATGNVQSATGSKSFAWSIPGNTGTIRLQKASDCTNITDSNRQYSLAGAVYGVYSDAACTAQVATLTTDASGAASANNLVYGSYWVKEITPPQGYLLNPKVYPASISATTPSVTVRATDTPRNDPIGITLTKISDGATADVAPLSGAQFTIRYYDGQYSSVSALPSTATRTWVIETKYNPTTGKYNTRLDDNYMVSGDALYYNANNTQVVLPLGTITIQETKAPVGYSLEGSYLNDNTGNSLADSDGIVLLNVVSNDTLNSGGTIRGGNQYTVTNYYMLLKTTASFEVAANTGDPAVTIRDEIYYENLTPDTAYTVIGTLMDKDTGEAVTDASGKKIAVSKTFTSAADSGYIRYVEFTVPVSIVGGRTLVVYEEVFEGTGSNRSVAPIASHKDIDDEAQTVTIPAVQTVAVEKATGAHVAKADGTVTIVDTVSVSNLIVGNTYRVSGVLMDKSTGEPLLDAGGKEITAETSFTASTADSTVELAFTLDAAELENTTVVAYEYLYLDSTLVGVHADPEDEDQTVHFPEIHTTALDAESSTHYAIADADVTIRDEVFYTNLISGQEYTVSGVLMDKSTGEPLLDAADCEIRAERTFVPSEANGSVVLEFTFDGSLLAGKTAVAFESLTYNGVEIAVHADLQDEDQTVYFPWIGTTAVDKETGTHTAAAAADASIVDTVEYSNLKPGASYTLVGVLMDKATGEPLLDADGKTVTSTVRFTPETATGAVDVQFDLDATGLDDRTVVVFESLYLGEETDAQPVAEHADIEDEEQSIHFPDIRTTALDAETETHVAMADADVTIRDRVFFSNLISGQEYTVSGVLMDKSTGEPLLDAKGGEIRSEQTFTPKTANGSIVLEFTFDGSLLEGKTAVAFERLTYNGVEVAVHADIEDEDQTVHFPEIYTTALDAESGSHYAIADADVTIQDEVFYSNLVVGQEYTVNGVLVDKNAKTALLDANGDEIRATATFTAEESDGSIVLEFTFDGSLVAGKTTVAFEQLTTEGIEVGVHADLEDEDQTVHFPSIGTVAVDGKTGKHTATAATSMTIVDTVEYANLKPGASYTLVGVLMDKDTGKAVTDADGKTVTSTVRFTPDEADGSVEVEFHFNGTKLGGHTVVVFESLYIAEGTDAQPVAEHRDLNDKAQSVTVNPPPPPGTPKTGDNSTLLPMTLLMLCSAVALLATLKGRRRATDA